MNWQEGFATDNSTWRSIEAYAAARMNDLTGVCLAPESTDQQIRQAQAGVAELQRLMALPQMIQAEVQQRAGQGKRKEY